MYLVVFDKTREKQLGFKIICHGCGLVSKLFKVLGKIPKRWTEELELAYTDKGNVIRSRRRGWTNNYYCYCCSGKCTAYTVAATSRKLLLKR